MNHVIAKGKASKRARLRLALLFCLTVMVMSPADAADLFVPDQRNGSIAFSVEHFGSFTSLGSFPQFTGRLLIDRTHLEQTKVDVDADATSVTHPWQGGTELLRGPDFFDVAHYPVVHFSSVSIRGVDPRHFEIDGTLEIRGVRRPLTLLATLEKQYSDPAKGADIADFTVTGKLSRSAYGMTADRMAISDEVTLKITVRVELPAQPARPH